MGFKDHNKAGPEPSRSSISSLQNLLVTPMTTKLTRIREKIPETSHAPYKYSMLVAFKNQSVKSIKFSATNSINLSSLSFRKTNMAMIPSFFGNRRSNSPFDPFSLDIWDPFKDFHFPQGASAFVNTRVDWKETPEAHVFKADLPGLKKEEVKVEVEDDRVLQISGERDVEKEDKNNTWHRVERSSGKFLRRFKLPENVKMDQIKASMDNGVLTVIVPKVEMKKPDVKSIEISG